MGTEIFENVPTIFTVTLQGRDLCVTKSVVDVYTPTSISQSVKVERRFSLPLAPRSYPLDVLAYDSDLVVVSLVCDHRQGFNVYLLDLRTETITRLFSPQWRPKMCRRGEFLFIHHATLSTDRFRQVHPYRIIRWDDNLIVRRLTSLDLPIPLGTRISLSGRDRLILVYGPDSFGTLDLDTDYNEFVPFDPDYPPAEPVNVYDMKYRYVGYEQSPPELIDEFRLLHTLLGFPAESSIPITPSLRLDLRLPERTPRLVRSGQAGSPYADGGAFARRHDDLRCVAGFPPMQFVYTRSASGPGSETPIVVPVGDHDPRIRFAEPDLTYPDCHLRRPVPVADDDDDDDDDDDAPGDGWGGGETDSDTEPGYLGTNGDDTEPGTDSRASEPEHYVVDYSKCDVGYGRIAVHIERNDRHTKLVTLLSGILTEMAIPIPLDPLRILVDYC